MTSPYNYQILLIPLSLVYIIRVSRHNVMTHFTRTFISSILHLVEFILPFTTALCMARHDPRNPLFDKLCTPITDWVHSCHPTIYKLTFMSVLFMSVTMRKKIISSTAHLICRISHHNYIGCIADFCTIS